LRSGIVAGGGSALVREAARLRADGLTGAGIDRAAATCMALGLEAVAIHIARNAGIDPHGFMQQLLAPAGNEIGFDARTGRVGNVIATGIADPFSITAGVVAQAASVAATMLRTEALICR
jgi:chaperonin GroEL